MTTGGLELHQPTDSLRKSRRMRFMRLPTLALLLPVLTLRVRDRRADTILFANLTNSQENPPAVPTTSTGTRGPRRSIPRSSC